MFHYRLSELKINIGESLDTLPAKAEKKLGLRAGSIDRDSFDIRRESIDARDKSDIKLVYTVDFYYDRQIKVRKNQAKNLKLIESEDREVPEPGDKLMKGRPVIAGFGPCGIFAALELAKRGYNPVVLERGSDMDGRVADVEEFRNAGAIKPDSNMLFGEGGAGTFSDGKLTSGIKDSNIRYVLETFRDAGAGDDILYLHRPHIGTDVLREVIVNIRKEIIALGGDVRFGHKLTGIRTAEGQVTGVEVEGPDGIYDIETEALVLAIGHSARDTFRLIKDLGVNMEQKPLSIGVRMEHPQEMIDRAQYGDEKRLPPADYKVSYKASNGRGVYSFCMCPGGEVVVCTTEEGHLCVNGMSNRKRDSGTANSGVLVDVRTSDYGSDDVLAGVEFQRKYEQLAYENGKKSSSKYLSLAGQQASYGNTYCPPTCTMREFLDGTGDAEAVIASLPGFAYEGLREAVPFFARKIHGYDSDDAIVKAVETRSSSPVRILRDAEGVSNIAGLYPAGEGAGYAGGITSAACDGIKAAYKIIEKYKG